MKSSTGTDGTILFPLSISQLAEAACTTVHTLRSYLSEGLLECASHTDAGYRLFDRGALDRLLIIRAAREAGLLVRDIKPLISALNAGDKTAACETIAVLQVKIAEKRSRLRELDERLMTLARIG